MADIVRNIGLSLGADLCWPACYEHIMRRLDLRIPHAGDNLRFEVERVTIEPFDLEQDCKYDVVIDRLTHWFHTSREWIKKIWVTKTNYAQPVPLVNHSKNIPTIPTPIEGLYFASMSQVYPWDRGTNFAVEIGRRAARMMLGS